MFLCPIYHFSSLDSLQIIVLWYIKCLIFEDNKKALTLVPGCDNCFHVMLKDVFIFDSKVLVKVKMVKTTL